jgi:phage-related baseplate assembly protein
VKTVDSRPELRYNTRIATKKGVKMQANTLQVRKVMRNAVNQLNVRPVTHSYTEKTSANFPARRSVVYIIANSTAESVLAKVQAEFNVLGYSNTATLTGTVYGSCAYLRCIADIA